MTKDYLFLSVAVLVLAACQSPQAARETATAASTHDLCMAATDDRLLRGNLKAAAVKELAIRNQDCDWAGYAQLQQQRRAAMLGFSAALLNQGSPQPIPQQPGGAFQTHTYILNGRPVTCTTSGTITNCF